MKITICGSVAFINEMADLSQQLEALGHEVKFPPLLVVDSNGHETHTSDYYQTKKSTPADDLEFWQNHTHRIRDHFSKVAWSDAILVLNCDKNDTANYIGPNTLMEMGVAFHLNKKIFLFNPVPDIACREEILGMQPVILAADLSMIL